MRFEKYFCCDHPDVIPSVSFIQNQMIVDGIEASAPYITKEKAECRVCHKKLRVNPNWRDREEKFRQDFWRNIDELMKTSGPSCLE